MDPAGTSPETGECSQPAARQPAGLEQGPIVCSTQPHPNQGRWMRTLITQASTEEARRRRGRPPTHEEATSAASIVYDHARPGGPLQSGGRARDTVMEARVGAQREDLRLKVAAAEQAVFDLRKAGEEVEHTQAMNDGMEPAQAAFSGCHAAVSAAFLAEAGSHAHLADLQAYPIPDHGHTAALHMASEEAAAEARARYFRANEINDELVRANEELRRNNTASQPGATPGPARSNAARRAEMYRAEALHRDLRQAETEAAAASDLAERARDELYRYLGMDGAPPPDS